MSLQIARKISVVSTMVILVENLSGSMEGSGGKQIIPELPNKCFHPKP